MQPRSPRIHLPPEHLDQRREELDAWADRERDTARRPDAVQRERVRNLVACPRCGAAAGEQCRRRNGLLRARNHERRRQLAVAEVKRRRG